LAKKATFTATFQPPTWDLDAVEPAPFLFPGESFSGACALDCLNLGSLRRSTAT